MQRLVENHRQNLVRYVLGLTKDESLSNDIVQEALVRLWNDARVKDETHGRRWLYRTCRNLALDGLKSQHRRAALHAANPHVGLPLALAGDPFEHVCGTQLRERFVEVLHQLPPRQREVLELRMAADLSYREIAELLETTTTNVGVLLHNAVKRLRVVLNDPDGKSVRPAVAERPPVIRKPTRCIAPRAPKAGSEDDPANAVSFLDPDSVESDGGWDREEIG